MSQKAIFKYYYGQQADMHTFYRIPKLLFTHEYFKDLSSDAKILYGLMLDRLSLSMKNKWFDEQNRAFIYFSVEDIMEMLNCGRNKAVKSLQELDSEQGIGLIEKKRQGFGKANVIYVKDFVIEEAMEATSFVKTIEQQEDPDMDTEALAETDMHVSEQEESVHSSLKNKLLEVPKTNFKKFTKQTSRSPENKLQEVYKRDSNYNNISYTEKNDNKSNLIISEKEEDTIRCEQNNQRKMQAYKELIRDNISFDDLLQKYPYEEQLLEGILDLILEVEMSQTEYMWIAKNKYPAALVKGKFMKLNFAHVEYVIESFQHNTTKISNIKNYLLTVLFNAPTTMSGYYKAQINHNMPELAH